MTKVLIVGAGPTGLTAALELARQGIIAKVIDKRDAASTLSRAVGITPRSLELLSGTGVDKDLIAESIIVKGMRIYRNNKLCLSVPFNSKAAYFHTLLGLPQDRTEAILAEAYAKLDGHVDYGVKFTGLKQVDNQIKVSMLKNGHEAVELYDYVIGADGVRSQVRESIGIKYLGYDLDETWSIADVNVDNWQHADEFTIFQLSHGKILVVVAIGKNRYRLVSNTANALKVLPIALNIKKINREGTFKISVRQAESYSKGRVHLAGDAAHCHSPVGGRGMNMGIGDAHELAKRLVAGDLESYSTVRHAEGRKVIPVTERGRRILSSKSVVIRSIFRSFLFLANNIPWLNKRLSRLAVEF